MVPGRCARRSTPWIRLARLSRPAPSSPPSAQGSVLQKKSNRVWVRLNDLEGFGGSVRLNDLKALHVRQRDRKGLRVVLRDIAPSFPPSAQGEIFSGDPSFRCVLGPFKRPKRLLQVRLNDPKAWQVRLSNLNGLSASSRATVTPLAIMSTVCSSGVFKLGYVL